MAEAMEDPSNELQPISEIETLLSSQEDSSEAGAARTSSTVQKRNAFTELMTRKNKAPKLELSTTPTQQNDIISSKPINPRDGLLPYIAHPENFSRNVVLRVSSNTVLIKDLFPKAAIHLLLLPRSAAHYNKHPHEAFKDPNFLAVMREEAASAAQLAAAELRRQTSPFSATIQSRNNAVDSGVPIHELPPDRDFSSDIRIGVHAHPSMNHLHIHIISRDMHSGRLNHRKHYNSFNTPFFIPLGDYPLSSDDQRRDGSFQNSNLKKDFVCWRCERELGSHFSRLKEHLETEFLEWRRV